MQYHEVFCFGSCYPELLPTHQLKFNFTGDITTSDTFDATGQDQLYLCVIATDGQGRECKSSIEGFHALTKLIKMYF